MFNWSSRWDFNPRCDIIWQVWKTCAIERTRRLLRFLSERRGSNPLHSAWKADTQPDELLSHWRWWWDLNPRPLPWQGSILINWTTSPKFHIYFPPRHQGSNLDSAVPKRKCYTAVLPIKLCPRGFNTSYFIILTCCLLIYISHNFHITTCLALPQLNVFLSFCVCYCAITYYISCKFLIFFHPDISEFFKIFSNMSKNL